MEMDQLSEFIAELRVKINALGPWPDRIPERQFQKQSQQCPKCLYWIPDEGYVEHFSDCRYECGLCAAQFETYQEKHRHVNQCVREIDAHRRR